jgi:LL-H family phage holin
MTLEEFVLKVLLLIISFVIPIITTYIVKYLQAKTGNENLKKYLNYAETAVRAAESIFAEPGSGEKKKAAVEKYLSEKIGCFFTAGEIDQLIEAAVFEINKTGKKLIYGPYRPVTGGNQD